MLSMCSRHGLRKAGSHVEDIGALPQPKIVMNEDEGAQKRQIVEDLSTVRISPRGEAIEWTPSRENAAADAPPGTSPPSPSRPAEEDQSYSDLGAERYSSVALTGEAYRGTAG